MKRQHMKRNLVAIGASAALLSFGGAAALANGSHSVPSVNTSNQSASNTQILPISLGLGAAVPVNGNVPVSALSAGSNGGNVEQKSEATAEGQSKNNETIQSVRQQIGEGGGSNTATQSSSSTQVIPVSIGAGAAAPINANVPVSALSAGANRGDVNQAGWGHGSARSANSATAQSADQYAARGAKNTATQSASNTQVLPIALGLGVAAPVNANVPVAVLSADANRGNVKQGGDAKARGVAMNNSVGQEIRQEGTKKGTENSATQSAANTQVLAAALGPALTLPVNANVPVAVLGAGPNHKDVHQSGAGDSYAESINNDLTQSARQSDSQQLVSAMLSNVAESMADGSAVQKMLGGL